MPINEVLIDTPLVAIFGRTPSVATLQFLIGHSSMDYSITDIASFIGYSRQTISSIIPKLMRYGLVKSSRIYGGTTLYKYDIYTNQGRRLVNFNSSLVDIIINEELAKMESSPS